MAAISYSVITIFKNKVVMLCNKRNFHFALFIKCVLLTSLLVIVSCSSPTAKKNKISLTLVASSDLNPDINGRASPLALIIYQLKNSSSFKKADYVSLIENGKSILGQDLTEINFITVQPGQTIDLNYVIAEGEGAFGIVAGYRVIDSSTWQLVYDYPRSTEGFFSKFNGTVVYSHKVLLKRNSIHLEPLPTKH
ncbi:type VI secretion system lipoprotein TssJ [Cellvibrio sp. OA-2007]|uniref:type VI secretion system lipoprotein TssJ n=1 Tax=Cellvibrio sp. OA-2007 TaxID=529823 RepID=UPI0007830CA8|nr:type VI secretion system lipoprotein TssJ [Cellvibrio sp. OA-2007]